MAAGLVLRRGADVPVGRQLREERLDVSRPEVAGGRRPSHLSGSPLPARSARSVRYRRPLLRATFAAVDAPRPSGARRALLIGLPVAALAAAAFLVVARDERPAPDARPPSAGVQRSPPAAAARGGARRPPRCPAAAAATVSAAAQESEPAPDTDPEASIIDRMRAALTSNPEEVLRLDDEASRDLGDSPRAAERGTLRVRALVRLDRIGQARSLAEDLIERYPDDPSAKSAAAYMGIHPRPRGPSR